MAAAKAKASRHAVTPRIRPQSKVSLPVASFVALSGRDGTNKVWCLTRSSRRAAVTGRTSGIPDGRVRKRHCCRSLPSEPNVKVSLHSAQADSKPRVGGAGSLDGFSPASRR
jgi:hypothetical protein